MGRINPKAKAQLRKQRRLSEAEEIELLERWVEVGKPSSGSNPISFPPLPAGAPVGLLEDGTFSAYAGCELFEQLPISRKTKDGLRSKFTKMSEIQRATLPHSLCGRDVLGAAKTGSGKTLAFIIPVLEKLYRINWGPEDGVGSIIISPTKELAGQLFDVLKIVGKFHGFSAGLLVGGRKDVDAEKECVGLLNILVCTPGRLLQHMDETPNFDCSQLQVLVLDEADRILDEGFKKELDAIISQLPRRRQTLLFSATQTKSVRDLARLNLKDPEYISVHAESVTATPEHLHQIAMEVPIEQKLDILWSFIRSHINSKMLVFLSTCKQVKYFFEIFKKLRPGVPLKCLHGRMKQNVRMAIYSQFCEERSVLFCTDVASRGLDFPAVDWVIQVDCPDDVATYIHRVGRTARFASKGRSVLFFTPSEKEMIVKLQAVVPKIPIQVKKVNHDKLQPVSGAMAAQLAKYPNLQELAKSAFIRYVRSVFKQKDKQVFDATKIPLDAFAASLGLVVTPRLRFLNKKLNVQMADDIAAVEQNGSSNVVERVPKQKILIKPHNDDENDVFLTKDASPSVQNEILQLSTRISKRKKLKINIDRPIGKRFVFDDEGNTQAPLAAFADTVGEQENPSCGFEKVNERWLKMREEMKERDREDKILQKKRRLQSRIKDKVKLNKWKEDQASEDDNSDVEALDKKRKKTKIYFSSDNDEPENNGKEMGRVSASSATIAEQEALALKLLSSLHS